MEIMCILLIVGTAGFLSSTVLAGGAPTRRRLGLRTASARGGRAWAVFFLLQGTVVGPRAFSDVDGTNEVKTNKDCRNL